MPPKGQPLVQVLTIGALSRLKALFCTAHPVWVGGVCGLCLFGTRWKLRLVQQEGRVPGPGVG